MSISSPKMFAPSVASIDVSQLCFNKAHFTRSDFDVQRFMTLARRRSDLKTIHGDLRLYLKSIQHSMVELINEDYAHFVNLSSNLVGLKTSIDSINNNVEGIWKEFNDTAKEALAQAEKIEMRCTELSAARDDQVRTKKQIAAVTAIKRLSKSLKDAPSPLTVIWLERVSSLVADASLDGDSLEEGSAAAQLHSQCINSLETRLVEEAVLSLRGDLTLLPLIFSLLSISRATDRLVSRVVSDVVEPSVSKDSSKTPIKLMQDVLHSILKLRGGWERGLRQHGKGPLMDFLDQSLLTYLLSFIDKSLSTHMTTSPSFFHSAFTEITNFIKLWPSPKASASHLRSIRGRFQLQVYFLQVATAPWRELQTHADPQKFVEVKNKGEGEFANEFFSHAYTTVSALWSENTFLLPLASKCWEQTTKILSLCISHTRAIRTLFSSAEEGGVFDRAWTALVCTRIDAERIGQALFDEALERIWPRLRELEVDTTPFGQTMNAFSAAMEKEGKDIQNELVNLLGREIETTLEGITQLPKFYRWTKKPSPTSASAYITSALSKVEEAVEVAKGRGLEGAARVGSLALEKAAATLLDKAVQVLDTVDATSSSLSRLKRREGTQPEGDSDEDKIRLQMSIDVKAIRDRVEGEEKEELTNGYTRENGNVSTMEAMDKLLLRLQGTNRQPSA